MFAGLGAEFGMPVNRPIEINTIDTFVTALGAGRLWVAADSTDRAVGFALVSEVDGHAHLEELDVLPEHCRRGLGSELVETACAWAREVGSECVTLSTFRDVPWNREFYEYCGFRVVQPSELTPGLRHIVEIEGAKGLNTKLRVVMGRDLTCERGRSWDS